MYVSCKVFILTTIPNEVIELPLCSQYEYEPLHQRYTFVWTGYKIHQLNYIFYGLRATNEIYNSHYVIKIIGDSGESIVSECKYYSSISDMHSFKLKLAKVDIDIECVKKCLESEKNMNNSIVPYNKFHDKNAYSAKIPAIKYIYFVEPYTTIEWADGSKTTVKAINKDNFDKELGVAFAITRKYYESFGVKYPRSYFKKDVYVNAFDMTKKVEEKRAYKKLKKMENNGISDTEKSDKKSD